MAGLDLEIRAQFWALGFRRLTSNFRSLPPPNWRQNARIAAPERHGVRRFREQNPGV